MRANAIVSRSARRVSSAVVDARKLLPVGIEDVVIRWAGWGGEVGLDRWPQYFVFDRSMAADRRLEGVRADSQLSKFRREGGAFDGSKRG